MWTAVIPWTWRLLAVVLLMLAAGTVGWFDGANHEAADRRDRENASLKQALQDVQRLQGEARAAEQRHAAALAAISTDYERKLDDANQRRAADRAALRAGTLRLRDPGPVTVSCADPTAEPGAGPGRRDGRAPGELSDAAAEFLLDFAADADAVVLQLAACQRVVNEDRAMQEKPRP
ncbi:MAG: lysis protein [Proteobacteria bacterium]|nr:lysis protein [Pseudomonadota bacterium]